MMMKSKEEEAKASKTIPGAKAEAAGREAGGKEGACDIERRKMVTMMMTKGWR